MDIRERIKKSESFRSGLSVIALKLLLGQLLLGLD